MEPMLLKPFLKPTIWGGNRLIKDFNKNCTWEKLGESWECSAHPNGSSIVASGKHQGKTLKQLLKDHPEYMGSKFNVGEELPILVKLIDAKEDLSIQVHPDDDYALRHEQQKGKTEMWYVVDAEPGAKIVYGFTHNMTAKLVEESIRQDCLLEQLQQIEVKAGDTFFIPAGTIHGIGAGCLIAEVQENSDVTYRVHDYDRIDTNGQKRELHLEKAMDVVRLLASKDLKYSSKLIRYCPGVVSESVCRCKYFEVERICINRSISINVEYESFQVILALRGSAVMTNSKYCGNFVIRKGDCVFLPAGLKDIELMGNLEFLKIRS